MSKHAKLLVPLTAGGRKPLGRKAAKCIVILVKAKIITRNEARGLIGLMSIEGGDSLD
jgi:hypothetical protein